MISISELFLKALKLIVMNMSQSFFDSNENCFSPILIKLFFLCFAQLMIFLNVLFEKSFIGTKYLEDYILNNVFCFL